MFGEGVQQHCLNYEVGSRSHQRCRKHLAGGFLVATIYTCFSSRAGAIEDEKIIHNRTEQSWDWILMPSVSHKMKKGWGELLLNVEPEILHKFGLILKLVGSYL